MIIRVGATGKFPQGTLGPDDEGEIQIAIGVTSDGTIIINFGKELAWIGLDQTKAIEFAKLILRKAGAKKIEVTL